MSIDREIGRKEGKGKGEVERVGEGEEVEGVGGGGVRGKMLEVCLLDLKMIRWKRDA